MSALSCDPKLHHGWWGNLPANLEDIANCVLCTQPCTFYIRDTSLLFSPSHQLKVKCVPPMTLQGEKINESLPLKLNKEEALENIKLTIYLNISWTIWAY